MKEDNKPMFSNWGMFYIGLCVGSILGNTAVYFLLNIFM